MTLAEFHNLFEGRDVLILFAAFTLILYFRYSKRSKGGR